MSRWWAAALHGLIVSCAVVAALAACDSKTASAPIPVAAPPPALRESPAGNDPEVRAPEPGTPPPNHPVAQEPLPGLRPPEGASPAQATGQDAGVAGFVIERTVRQKIADLTGRESEFHRIERVKIRGARVSIEDETFGRRLIIRPDLGLAWLIDRVDGTYSEVTFDAVAKRRADVCAELRSALRRVEGSSDAAPIEDTLLRLGELPEGTPVSIRSTERAEKIGGRDAVGREIRIGSGISYINVMVDPALEGALGYFEALAKLGAFHPAVAERLKQLGGFPVRGEVRYAFLFDLVKATEEVTSAVRGDVADSEFEKPAGLTKVPNGAIDPASWTPPAKPRNFARSFLEDEIDRERNPFRQDDKK